MGESQNLECWKRVSIRNSRVIGIQRANHRHGHPLHGILSVSWMGFHHFFVQTLDYCPPFSLADQSRRTEQGPSSIFSIIVASADSRYLTQRNPKERSEWIEKPPKSPKAKLSFFATWITVSYMKTNTWFIWRLLRIKLFTKFFSALSIFALWTLHRTSIISQKK